MTDERISPQQKAFVAERARYCCEYCMSQVSYSPDPFSVDHIIPRSSGGTNVLENLAFACLGCNNKKFTTTTAIDPVTGVNVPLYHPRHHDWHTHFAWDENFYFFIGLTPIGRATIERLELNRKGVVNLRMILRTVGKHPPY